MGNFKELRVWQESMAVVKEIYQIISETDIKKDYSLKNQMWRSSISIPSNIAEGDELDTNKQSIRHFYIAKGSIAELITQLEIAQMTGQVAIEIKSDLEGKLLKISAMLQKLINARKNS